MLQYVHIFRYFPVEPCDDDQSSPDEILIMNNSVKLWITSCDFFFYVYNANVYKSLTLYSVCTRTQCCGLRMIELIANKNQ